MNPQMGQGGMFRAICQREEKVLFKKLKLSGLKVWMEENKNKALNLLAEYHDIFVLEDGEMGCTKAAEHKIKVTDPQTLQRETEEHSLWPP